MENKQGLPNWEEYTTEGKLTSKDVALIQQQWDFWQSIEMSIDQETGEKRSRDVYSDEIAEMLELNIDKQPNLQKIGLIIKELLCQWDIPIVSSAKGYYKTISKRLLQKSMNSWLSKANSAIKRANAYHCFIYNVDRGPYDYFEIEEDELLDNKPELF